MSNYLTPTFESTWSVPMRSLNILVISRCPPWPLHLGDRLILYHLASQLEARRHNMDLLAFYQRPADLADQTYYDRLFRSVELVREPERSTDAYLSRRLIPRERFPEKATKCWSPEMWRLIKKKLKDNRYDVLHLFGGITVYEYFNIAHEHPNVITPYESYSLLLQRQAREESGYSLLERMAARLRLSVARNYESWMFSGFYHTVMVSQKDAAVVRELDSSAHIKVIPNGVDLEKFSSSEVQSKEPIVMFTGNFSYKPNQDAAMMLAKKVFPRIRKYVPEARLMLVGANPTPKMQQLGEAENITVTGRVPDMRVYLDQAAVYVSPLRVGAGIKNKILEAMAMSVPVVATPLSFDGISIIKNKSAFMAQKPSEMAEWTVALIKNPSLSERIGAAGRTLIEQRYTWNRVADQYEMLYESAIDKHKARQ